MERIKYRSIRGLSLIEILIAIGVLSVGVLAVIGMFPSFFKLNANSWTTTQVMLLTQEKMDEILSSNAYISTTPSTDYPGIIPRDGSGNPLGYRRWWGESDPGGNTNIQIIKVEVVWTERSRVKRYTLTGAVAP
ncbi:MAG: prepilin-type N-terminal cleavage/methylation domain-containing protein [Firmicutes bacterium]|nr:prepilin-type N-terminal cleavage/methylation domain-containing protein [Bacillota bacterium]